MRRREAERGTHEPLYGLLALGALQLAQLREDYRVQQGEAFSSSNFHDAVLSAGLVPVTVLVQTTAANSRSVDAAACEGETRSNNRDTHSKAGWTTLKATKQRNVKRSGG